MSFRVLFRVGGDKFFVYKRVYYNIFLNARARIRDTTSRDSFISFFFFSHLIILLLRRFTKEAHVWTLFVLWRGEASY